MHIDEIIQLGREQSVEYRGGFSVLPADQVPHQANGDPSCSLLLFGQVGSSIWPIFKDSEELADNQENPLDRWSQRVGQAMSGQLNGKLLLPFGEAPFHPFLSWATRADTLMTSRLGLSIHPTYGLWHAYRFAIALPVAVTGLESSNIETGGSDQTSICSRCDLQPCLTICPVQAFSEDGYDVKSCFEYLDENPTARCHKEGCEARNACPVGIDFQYNMAHRQFHMKQFYSALHKRYKSGDAK